MVEAAYYCHTDAVLAAGKIASNPPLFPHIGYREFGGIVVASVNPAVSLRVGVKSFSFLSHYGCAPSDKSVN
ncbi:hypothetical protein HZ326_16561 [Fusarium oxysporum f. sp. albedinis]|nr:hypothetical protein HZ326_16561 [Fusarium oxysporum f. sp. albedinis]